MTWLLVLTLSLDGRTADQPVGIMFDERACAIAGAGSVLLLEEANPGLEADWTCVRQLREAV